MTQDKLSPEDRAAMAHAKMRLELAQRDYRIAVLELFVRYGLTAADGVDLDTGEIKRAGPNKDARIAELEAQLAAMHSTASSALDAAKDVIEASERHAGAMAGMTADMASLATAALQAATEPH